MGWRRFEDRRHLLMRVEPPDSPTARQPVPVQQG